MWDFVIQAGVSLGSPMTGSLWVAGTHPNGLHIHLLFADLQRGKNWGLGDSRPRFEPD